MKSGVQGALRRVDNLTLEKVLEKGSESGPAAVLYLVALGVLYKSTNKLTPLLLVLIGAIAGQFIFI